MATLVLSTVGGMVGGSVFGPLGAVAGRAIGAFTGNWIGQAIFGDGSQAIDAGKVDRFNMMTSASGRAIVRVYGRARVAGQVIWASRFYEHVTAEKQGGKGAPKTEVNQHHYTISLAVALGEGVVDRIGQIWMDGQPVDISNINYRLYNGTTNQLADPVIVALEGVHNTPAYKDIAYIVFEDLNITNFGNHIPQIQVEVFRKSSYKEANTPSLMDELQGVALIPGTGEYSLATSPVFYDEGMGVRRSANMNNRYNKPDLCVSVEQLKHSLPNCKSTSLVVSWFGSDLRCSHCEIKPKIEQRKFDGDGTPWMVSGLTRNTADLISKKNGSPNFGGSISDDSVMDGIKYLKSNGIDVMFYPFLLMDVPEDNNQSNPWQHGTEAYQPAMPWRGRITLEHAPEMADSTDKTAAAGLEIDVFFGNAKAIDFSISDSLNEVIHNGPEEWTYSRFILHNAMLCKMAGGVDAFCIGSELRSLTTVRGAENSFPMVEKLIALAFEVRGILGAATKIGYAADWSEYFGYHPTDGSGDVFFHLDALWASSDIDFIGIDNYMPLSDWRDGFSHLDANAATLYDLEYLKSNIEGGEGYDWYYLDDEARYLQSRSQISDDAYMEPWVFRYKDIKSWWGEEHFNRIGGVRQIISTEWQPKSKPIWFTELGCPAVDKGTNQPNVFYDPKSSESALPYHSNGAPDEYIQCRYLQAMYGYWTDPNNNPISPQYEGHMIAMNRAFVWAWDARPWPEFPNRTDLWSDGPNYRLGHWVSGRVGAVSLADVVFDICKNAGVKDIDVSQLYGLVKGYVISQSLSAKQILQPLMLAYGFDVYTVGGTLTFLTRGLKAKTTITTDEMVRNGVNPVIEFKNISNNERSNRVQIEFQSAEKNYQADVVEIYAGTHIGDDVSRLSLPITLSQDEAVQVAERWLHEGEVSREKVKFELPLSFDHLNVGSVISVKNGTEFREYRIDQILSDHVFSISATCVEPLIYQRSASGASINKVQSYISTAKGFSEFLDLPMLTSKQDDNAPFIVASATPWQGNIAVYQSLEGNSFDLNMVINNQTIVGETLENIGISKPSCWSHDDGFLVQIYGGELYSRTKGEVLNGKNMVAVKHASGEWELFQFQNADIQAQGIYRLSGLLRGQFGTEFLVNNSPDIGSQLIFLKHGTQQLQMNENQRGQNRIYRIGLATRPYTDPCYLEKTFSFNAISLRPYQVTHLRHAVSNDGAINLSWIRRTRMNGDSWEGIEVPLAEEKELYSVKLFQNNELVRKEQVKSHHWHYSAVDRDDETGNAPIIIDVSQISERFGAGPSQRIEIND